MSKKSERAKREALKGSAYAAALREVRRAEARGLRRRQRSEEGFNEFVMLAQKCLLKKRKEISFNEENLSALVEKCQSAWNAGLVAKSEEQLVAFLDKNYPADAGDRELIRELILLKQKRFPDADLEVWDARVLFEGHSHPQIEFYLANVGSQEQDDQDSTAESAGDAARKNPEEQ